MIRQKWLVRCSIVAAVLGAPVAWGATPKVADALKLTPTQPGISYDQPDAGSIADCTIKAEKINGSTAWVVRAASGDLLRQFADSDGDNVVDTWSYFQDGLEIYRDVDANHNGKADQFRWFHSAGIRWGLDENEDGGIDNWKLISAEETAEEVVGALQSSDVDRFKSLLLTEADIDGLGLEPGLAEQLRKRTESAVADFKKLAAEGVIATGSDFTDFGGLKPGMVPAGTRGSTKDIMVYENAWAMVRTQGEHQQLQLGTLVSVKGAWKLADGPMLGNVQTSLVGFFFSPEGGAGESMTTPIGAPPSEKMQEVMAQLEQLDQNIPTAGGDEMEEFHLARANTLLELSKLAGTRAEREQWLHQLADAVSAAAQDGSFPQGIEYLRRMEANLAAQNEPAGVLAYFEFHRMLAEYYGETLAKPDLDFAEAQAKWQKDLENYIARHPQSELGSEALRMLALNSEMAGASEEAVKWYLQIVEGYSEKPAARMARGAIVRLTSEGKRIPFAGQTLDGKQFDLAAQRGKAVLLQYWVNSCEVCKADHDVLKELYAKYGNSSLEIVSVNLDYEREEMLGYLRTKRLPWKQMYEAQGFDGPLASDLGVVTVPLMLLIGPQGEVISSNIQAAEVEEELEKLRPGR